MTIENQPHNKNSSVVVNAQYIKDLSFENPKAPEAFMMKEQPAIDVALDVTVNPLDENVFEVVLSIHAKAIVDEKDVFIIELDYAGVFTVSTEDINEREVTLLVYCPAILFPYARRIVSDVSRDGGYPPLMIAPIDFMSLYLNKKEMDVASQAKNDNNHIN